MGSSSRAVAFKATCFARSFLTRAVLEGAFFALGAAFLAGFFAFLAGFFAVVDFLVEEVAFLVAVRPVCFFGRPTGFAAAVAYVLA